LSVFAFHKAPPTARRPEHELTLATEQGLFIPLEGLTEEGSFKARKDKKGKKGQKPLSSFCPSLPFLP
jgi:hypothetical protein